MELYFLESLAVYSSSTYLAIESFLHDIPEISATLFSSSSSSSPSATIFSFSSHLSFLYCASYPPPLHYHSLYCTLALLHSTSFHLPTICSSAVPSHSFVSIFSFFFSSTHHTSNPLTSSLSGCTPLADCLALSPYITSLCTQSFSMHITQHQGIIEYKRVALPCQSRWT